MATMNDYKKLNNQPLQVVLAEFRFSPVMQIADYIPKIQEALRKSYPIPEKSSEQVIQVQQQGIEVTNIARWAFISANKKSAIDINQERLVFITTEYPRFDGFSDCCKFAIDVLASVVEPSLIQRIGLRYSDLVKLEADEKVSDLINAHFGFPVCVANLGEAQQHRSETALQTAEGILVIRALYGNHPLICAPDLNDLPIVMNHDVAPSERVVLDFDHYWEAKNDSVSFEVDDVLERLRKLHDTSREAFWNITTEYARNEKWS